MKISILVPSTTRCLSDHRVSFPANAELVCAGQQLPTPAVRDHVLIPPVLATAFFQAAKHFDSDSILGIDVNVANGNVIGINSRGGDGYRHRIDPNTGSVFNLPFNTPPHSIDLRARELRRRH